MRSNISFDANIKLFDALVKPILLYGCQVLAPHTTIFKNMAEMNNSGTNEKYFTYLQNDSYEKFHLKFLKWSCGVHRKASKILNAIKLTIDYFDRAETANTTSLLYKSFCEQKKLNLDWYKNILSIKQKFCHGNLNRNSINATKI